MTNTHSQSHPTTNPPNRRTKSVINDFAEEKERHLINNGAWLHVILLMGFVISEFRHARKSALSFKGLNFQTLYRY
jgi:hypothetical protein